MTPREKKEHEDLMRKVEEQNAKTDYIAMMTDVDIPDEGDSEQEEQEELEENE